MTDCDMVDYRACVKALEAELRGVFQGPIDGPAGQIAHSLAVRYWDGGMAAVLRATDDELLTTHYWGPGKLARWRAVVPEPVDTRDPAWIEHAEMVAGTR
jgi:hypothetical protein